jgi:hypothetical protein
MIACIQPEPGAGVCVCVSKVSELYIIARCSSNKRKTQMTRGRERERDLNGGQNEIWAGKRISSVKPNLRRENEIGLAGGTPREPRIEVGGAQR